MANEKFCLITGASRGLGRFLSEHLWASGWSLFLVARDRAALQGLARSLGDRPHQSVHVASADLAQDAAIDRLMREAKSALPRIDLLINNAAIQGPVGVAWENNWQEWLAAVQVDLLAPVRLCATFVPWMMATGGGSIVNLSGGGATGVRANFSAYATAKTGLVRFSEILAEELKSAGIRVNCVAPGAMDTDMLREIVAKGEAAAGKKEYEAAVRVLSGGGAPQLRVAQLCAFLGSPESQGITGKLISAVWDNWEQWVDHLDELRASDAYTLRRIAGRDRAMPWGDK